MNKKNVKKAIRVLALHKSQQRAKLHGDESGKIGWALLWLVGVPLPLLLVLYFFFGN